jgi:hypothetical protein
MNFEKRQRMKLPPFALQNVSKSAGIAVESQRLYLGSYITLLAFG